MKLPRSLTPQAIAAQIAITLATTLLKSACAHLFGDDADARARQSEEQQRRSRSGGAS